MSITFDDDYEQRLYSIHNSILDNNDLFEAFELLYLNRNYVQQDEQFENYEKKTPEKRFFGTYTGIIRNTIIKRPGAFAFKGISGISLNISKSLFDIQYENLLQYFNEETEERPAGPKQDNSELQISWNDNYPGTTSSILRGSQFSEFSRVMVTIKAQDIVNNLYKMFNSELQVYLVDLRYGSVKENVALIQTLEEVRKFFSHSRDSPIPYTLLGMISPRQPMTGFLRKGKDSIELKRCNKIIITADREYFSKGSHKVIYINCTFIIGQLKRNDYIHIDDITLRVLKQVNISAECLIVQEGQLRPQTKVIFPKNLAAIQMNRISAEELEDITFCLKAHIYTIVLPSPGNSDYYDSIRCSLNLMNCNYFRILTKVNQNLIDYIGYAKWIVKTYDGIILDIFNEPIITNQIVRFTNEARYLIENCYRNFKVVFLSKFMPKKCFQTEMIITAGPEDEKYFFYYADGILLQDYEVTKVHLDTVKHIFIDWLAKIENYCKEEFCKRFPDRSLTASNTFARAIVQASYDINAKGIIVCTASGRTIEKLSHYRPKCPIVAVTNNINLVNYIKYLPNVLIAYYREVKETDVQSMTDGGLLKKLTDDNDDDNFNFLLDDHQRLNLKKLFLGVLFAVSRRLFTMGDVILFGCRNIGNFAYPNSFFRVQIDDSFFDNILSLLNE